MDDITPADLARELGLDARTIRIYLREKHGKLLAPETRWKLSPSQADDVRRRFRG